MSSPTTSSAVAARTPRTDDEAPARVAEDSAHSARAAMSAAGADGEVAVDVRGIAQRHLSLGQIDGASIARATLATEAAKTPGLGDKTAGLGMTAPFAAQVRGHHRHTARARLPGCHGTPARPAAQD